MGNEPGEGGSDSGAGVAVPQELVRKVIRKVAMIIYLRMVGANYMQFGRA